MNDVFILGAKRTALGGFQGALADKSAPELGAHAIQSAMANAKVEATQIDEVYMGCVLPAGLGQAPARQAALGAGLPLRTPTTTLNKVCGSGMKAVMAAADHLRLGDAQACVAGGMESMTRAPYLSDKLRGGARMGHVEFKDHMFFDGLQNAYDDQELMGCFAENTADLYQLTREDQDAYAIRSLERALKAQSVGAFENEISPIDVVTRKATVTVTSDEQPANARPDKIPSLRPAFRKEGTVTAANSSSISDGAAALVLAGSNFVHDTGLRPRARIVGYTSFAQEPEWFTTAPVGAVKKLLDQIGWHKDKVDLWEVNEAFAAVPMAFMQELGLEADKVNVNGGACALGHPLGASGARIIVTLLNALEKRNLKKGIATLCIGGGEATAIAIERL